MKPNANSSYDIPRWPHTKINRKIAQNAVRGSLRRNFAILATFVHLFSICFRATGLNNAKCSNELQPSCRKVGLL